MDHKKHLNEVPLAKISDQEAQRIKELEQQFGDKYYLIAFKKE